jgi:hypothetical protein
VSVNASSAFHLLDLHEFTVSVCLRNITWTTDDRFDTSARQFAAVGTVVRAFERSRISEFLLSRFA